MFDGTTELQSDIPDVEVDTPLRISHHEDVRALQEEIEEKEGALKDLRRNRREADARRSELEEKFEESLRPETDTDPEEVREERLELEEDLDRFQERRTRLQAEIATLRQRLNEAAEEAREEISEAAGEPLRQLHAAFAFHLEQTIKAVLELRRMDDLEWDVQRVPGLDRTERHKARPELPVDDPQFHFPNGLLHAYKILQSLRRDGFNIDGDLLDRLKQNHVR